MTGVTYLFLQEQVATVVSVGFGHGGGRLGGGGVKGWRLMKRTWASVDHWAPLGQIG